MRPIPNLRDNENYQMFLEEKDRLAKTAKLLGKTMYFGYTNQKRVGCDFNMGVVFKFMAINYPNQPFGVFPLEPDYS